MIQVKQKNIPDGWIAIEVGRIFDFLRSYAVSRDNLIENTHNDKGIGNIHYGDIHAKFNATRIDLNDISVPMAKDDGFSPNKEDFLIDGDLIMADTSEDYEGIGVAVLVGGLGNKKVVGGLHTFALRDNKKKTNQNYRQYIFRNPEIRNKLQKIANGVSVYGISKTNLSKIILNLPPLPEQKQIAEVLEAWDVAIGKLGEKIEIKKRVKKGLMRELLTGKTRLPRFSGEWETKEIGELLEYEQPTKYLVANKDYDEAHKTPVLTANKSFILGHTNETSGIYINYPVIIFDDFTVDNKFVDFPFKVKSSAIKILKQKNEQVNIRFVFERMQLIKFSVGQHKRNYISEYQYLTMDMPNINEQNAIADILTAADGEIEGLERKLGILKRQKKFLLNNLVTGKIRVPERV